MDPAADFARFAAAYAAGEPQLLTLSLVGDCETPVAAFLKLRHAYGGPAFLLESVEGGAVRGRYSMIGLDPDLIWRCHRGQASLRRLCGLLPVLRRMVFSYPFLRCAKRRGCGYLCG